MVSLSHVPPTPLTPELYDYSLRIGLREPDVIRQLREETAARPHGEWSIAPEQGPLLQLLVELLGAKSVLELGTFTGASTLWMAMGLPEDGRIIAMDISEDDTAIAQHYWIKAGLAPKIDLRLQPALATLDELLTKPELYDFAFIDADKANVVAYYERCLKLIRPGGLIAIDNTLWDGKPADPSITDESTLAIRRLNALIHADQRVDLCFLALSDGLTICRKRRAS
jgi:predicted O-methyltransferase YrrM